MDFTYQIESKDKHSVIRLKGSLLDKTQAVGLLTEVDKLVTSGSTRFVVNMSGMDYINSSGINMLVNILTKSRTKGGDIIVTNVSDKVKQLFLITKLNTLFTITDSQEEAEKNINQ